MTAQIQRELDTTRKRNSSAAWRSCHRRTEETTTSMRRVVADQIKALNELSSLVTRSSRAVDVVQSDAARHGAASEQRDSSGRQRSRAGRGRVHGAAPQPATSASQSAMAAVAEAVSRPPAGRAERNQPAPRHRPPPLPAPEPQPAAQPGQEPAREQPFLKRRKAAKAATIPVSSAPERAAAGFRICCCAHQKMTRPRTETGKITETSAKAGGARPG